MTLIATSDRLYIRELTLDDAEFMLKLVNQESYKHYIAYRNIQTLSDSQSFIQKYYLDNYKNLGLGFYAIVLKDSNTPIGINGFAKRDFLDDVDLGFAFLDEYAGNGYAYESSLALIEYAKTTLKLNRIIGFYNPSNTSSDKLLKKLGFIFEKTIISPTDNLNKNIVYLTLLSD